MILKLLKTKKYQSQLTCEVSVPSRRIMIPGLIPPPPCIIVFDSKRKLDDYFRCQIGFFSSKDREIETIYVLISKQRLYRLSIDKRKKDGVRNCFFAE